MKKTSPSQQWRCVKRSSRSNCVRIRILKYCMFSTTQMTECHVFHLWSECYVHSLYLVVRETYLQCVRVTWKHVTEICLPSASRLYAQLGQENPTETDMILLMWELTTVFRKSNLWSVASSIAQPYFRGHFVLITDSWNPSIKLLRAQAARTFFGPDVGV